MDKFTCLESSVSSTENDTNTRLPKALIGVDKLFVLRKSDLLHPIKYNPFFFPSSDRVNTTIWMLHMDADWAYGEKAWRQLHKNAASCIG